MKVNIFSCLSPLLTFNLPWGNSGVFRYIWMSVIITIITSVYCRCVIIDGICSIIVLINCVRVFVVSYLLSKWWLLSLRPSSDRGPSAVSHEVLFDVNGPLRHRAEDWYDPLSTGEISRGFTRLSSCRYCFSYHWIVIPSWCCEKLKDTSVML